MTETIQRQTTRPAGSSPGGPAREEYRRTLERLQARQQVVADVIAGRLRLMEAAARFRDAQGACPTEDDERLCRAVIGWVYLALSDRPERAEALSQELERELLTVLSHHGAVRLP
jgi:hypothetical protein